MFYPQTNVWQEYSCITDFRDFCNILTKWCFDVHGERAMLMRDIRKGWKGGRFIRFPTPKPDLEKVKRWIKACGQSHEQLNIARIKQHNALCSKHFVGGNGPTENYPHPIQADGSCTMPARILPVKRSSQQMKPVNINANAFILEKNTTTLNSPDMNCESGVSTQTENPWISAMDMIAVAAGN